MLAQGTDGGAIGVGTVVIYRRPPAPSFESADISGGNSVARQRASIGDSLNDEK